MQVCKIQVTSGLPAAGVIDGNQVRLLKSPVLAEYLHVPSPLQAIQQGIDVNQRPVSLDGESADDPHLLSDVRLLAPVDQQEIWAAGVTYKRSQEARERESVGAARFYDLVYTAPRPELFFKANPHRVSAPGERVHIRRDSRWSVPEPELALVVSPRLRIVGYTIGNDMSARDIEGENPLYL